MKLIQLIIAFLIMFLLGMLSCSPSQNLVDNDDMYIQKTNRDTTISTKIVRRTPYHNDYYTPNYGWYGWGYSYGYQYQYYRPTTIIVVPKSEPEFKYGKRPDREGNGGVGVPLNRRRGRD